VAPRSVRLTSPERVLFPKEGITKQDLFEYYRAIAPVLVPHLRNRPFTMKRSPYGVRGEAYFQKQAPKGMPSWIPTRTFRTYPLNGRNLPGLEKAKERLGLGATTATSCGPCVSRAYDGSRFIVREVCLVRATASIAIADPELGSLTVRHHFARLV
jgi:hypothetical protein